MAYPPIGSPVPRFDANGNATFPSLQQAQVNNRQHDMEAAYKEASEDPGVQEKIKKDMLEQVSATVYEMLLAKRRKEFENLTNINGIGGSGLIPGYKYSYSGADAKAWAYYPGKGQQLADERERLLRKLKSAENAVRTRDEAQNQNSMDWAEAGYDTNEVSSLQDQINSLAPISGNGWVQLSSMATLSLNIHEPRAQVRALGHKGIKGFAGSVRTIAGTMIFTIVEGHPLRNLMLIDTEIGDKPSHKGPWSIDNYLTGRGTAHVKGDKLSKLATMLTPFNMHIEYKSEYMPTNNASYYTSEGMGAALAIEGIQIISEGIVTSVNDIVTEISYQFIAEDAKEFSGQIYAEMVKKFPEDTLNSSHTEENLAALGSNYDDLITSNKYSSEYENLVDKVMLDEVSTRLGTEVTRPTEEEIANLRGSN